MTALNPAAFLIWLAVVCGITYGLRRVCPVLLRWWESR